MTGIEIIFSAIVSAVNDTRMFDKNTVRVDVADLIARAQKGDRDAVSGLYQIHVGLIYRYIVFRVPTSADAEDLTSEVFVRMVEHLPNYRVTGAPFESWLYQIAGSLISDFYRRAKRRPQVELSEINAVHEDGIEDTLTQDQLFEPLREALQQLPQEQQDILILRFVERKSHDQVALLLGKSVTAVKSMQHRALIRLTELLGHQEKVRHYLRGAR